MNSQNPSVGTDEHIVLEDDGKQSSLPPVLIVEDDEEVNRLVRKLLKREGFQTVYALNGNDAIAAARKNPEVIMLLDFMLPDMTGEQVVKTLKEQNCSVPFIIMTGHSDTQLAVQMMKAGARDYIVKHTDFIAMLPHVIRQVAREIERENAIVRSQHNLRKILDFLPVGAVLIRNDKIIRQINQKALELIGYDTAADVEGKVCHEIFCPREQGKCPIIDCHQPLDTSERILITRERTSRPILKSAILVPLEKDEEVLVETFTDISDLKQAEEGLQNALIQWQTTFDAAQDSICLLDANGIILECNQATARFLGKPPDELIGRTCWEIVHGTTEPIENCPVKRMLTSRQRERLILQSGEKWFEVTADPGLDEKGELNRAVHIMSDITERKQAEETLRQQFAELQRWYDLTLDRETRVLDLKTEVNDLLRLLHEPIRYPSAENTGDPISTGETR